MKPKSRPISSSGSSQGERRGRDAGKENVGHDAGKKVRNDGGKVVGLRREDAAAESDCEQPDGEDRPECALALRGEKEKRQEDIHLHFQRKTPHDADDEGRRVA